jgi:hypothetical protein
MPSKFFPQDEQALSDIFSLLDKYFGEKTALGHCHLIAAEMIFLLR